MSSFGQKPSTCHMSTNPRFADITSCQIASDIWHFIVNGHPKWYDLLSSPNCIVIPTKSFRFLPTTNDPITWKYERQMEQKISLKISLLILGIRACLSVLTWLFDVYLVRARKEKLFTWFKNAFNRTLKIWIPAYWINLNMPLVNDIKWLQTLMQKISEDDDSREIELIAGIDQQK